MQPIDEPPLTPVLIRSRADAVMQRLRAVAEAAGRDPDVPRLVAVTKGFGVEVARAAAEAGLDRLGENRVQEAADKVAVLPDVEWHLVGHLQSNKARPAVRLFSTIHSVDSLELLERLDRIAGEEERGIEVLLQVNVAGEERKAGFEVDAFERDSGRGGTIPAAIRATRAARVRGLMAMLPAGISEPDQRALFARLRTLRDRLSEAIGEALPELSMGMSADASAAAAEGATLVRIGTAIFGPRPDHH